MLVFIDDGSTNIKLQWQESDGTIKQHISPNSFKREWAVSFGDKKVFNYTLNGCCSHNQYRMAIQRR